MAVAAAFAIGMARGAGVAAKLFAVADDAMPLFDFAFAIGTGAGGGLGLGIHRANT